MKFEFEFSFEFEFVLKYGNKRPIQPYMEIYQIQKYFYFLQKSTINLPNPLLKNPGKKTEMAYIKLTWPNYKTDMA